MRTARRQRRGAWQRRELEAPNFQKIVDGLIKKEAAAEARKRKRTF